MRLGVQEVLREWKAAHAAITESLLQEETITGAKLEQLMDENPPTPGLADLSDWTVHPSLVTHLGCIHVLMRICVPCQLCEPALIPRACTFRSHWR